MEAVTSDTSREQKGPLRPVILTLEAEVLIALVTSVMRSEARDLPVAQICSPIIEMRISALQLEHLMVGRKLDARVVDAMIALHIIFTNIHAEECSFVYISTQLFVFVPRA